MAQPVEPDGNPYTPDTPTQDSGRRGVSGRNATRLQRNAPIAILQIRSSSTTAPARCEGMAIPPNSHVEVGPDPSNTAAVFVGKGQNEVKATGTRMPFAPGSNYQLLTGIRNTAELWALPTVANEAAIVRVYEDAR